MSFGIPGNRRIRGIGRLAAAACALAAALAQAASQGRISWTEENDGIISPADRHYTQGGLLSFLSPPLDRRGFWNASFDGLGRVLPGFLGEEGSQRRIEWQLGQSQFTPANIERRNPNPRDRPYAAWLYTGVEWLQENHDGRLHEFDAQIGIIGPGAGGQVMQNGFHTVFNFTRARGWNQQLPNRAALQFSYQYRRRLQPWSTELFDVVPQAGISLGTVLRDAELGLLLRTGNALASDYGPERVRPALSGGGFVDTGRAAPRPGFSFFAGAQLRRVLYNHFIDESDQVAAKGLERLPWVDDLVCGASYALGDGLRVDLTATRRSPEFETQRDFDVYGAVTISGAL